MFTCTLPSPACMWVASTMRRARTSSQMPPRVAATLGWVPSSAARSWRSRSVTASERTSASPAFSTASRAFPQAESAASSLGAQSASSGVGTPRR